MTTESKKTRPKPTQDEALDWLKANEPALFNEAVKERDWVWVRIGPVPSDARAMIAQGWRKKKETTHKLPDGTDAQWYHSCQGKWRRGGFKKRKAKPAQGNTKGEMTPEQAWELANSL